MFILSFYVVMTGKEEKLSILVIIIIMMMMMMMMMMMIIIIVSITNVSIVIASPKAFFCHVIGA